MNINDTKLDALRKERKQCLARIEQIDRILEAVRVLVTEELIPVSDMVAVTVEEVNHKGLKRSGRVAARNTAVWEDIENRGKRYFTVPGVSRRTGLDKRRTKRAIDHFIDKGKVVIAKEGYKSRATRYKMIQME